MKKRALIIFWLSWSFGNSACVGQCQAILQQPAHQPIASPRVTTPHPDLKTAMTLYYVPFGIETYGAITPQNIKAQSYKIENVPKDEGQAVLALLNGKPSNAEYYSGTTRLLVERGSRDPLLYVNQQGCVLLGKERFKLSKEALVQLQLRLAKIYKLSKTQSHAPIPDENAQSTNLK